MKVYLDTVGCRLNQAEIEHMAGQFRAAGHEVVATAKHADLAVVNTCTVTAHAAADSRGMLRRIAGQVGGDLVATGCWATLRRDQAMSMPGVQHVIANADKESLVPTVLGWDMGQAASGAQPRRPIPGARHRTRAFIKVQDGCDNRCTFCVTVMARGHGRSRPIQDVIEDARAALLGGAQEIVLTGVHLGSWGSDVGLHLQDLVRAILLDTDVPRLRLSSLEPWDLNASFFRLWDDERLCRSLHMPLQSGCETTLGRMSRRTTPASFRDLVVAARSQLPDMAITTDVIAGFPGETEAEHRDSLEFVREIGFAGGHAFSYSPMAGTAASRMRGQLSATTRRQRTHQYLELFKSSNEAFRLSQLGSRRRVLWESVQNVGSESWEMRGQTDNSIRVRAVAKEPRWNKIDRVLLRDQTHNTVQGIIIESG